VSRSRQDQSPGTPMGLVTRISATDDKSASCRCAPASSPITSPTALFTVTDQLHRPSSRPQGKPRPLL